MCDVVHDVVLYEYVTLPGQTVVLSAGVLNEDVHLQTDDIHTCTYQPETSPVCKQPFRGSCSAS